MSKWIERTIRHPRRFVVRDEYRRGLSGLFWPQAAPNLGGVGLGAITTSAGAPKLRPWGLEQTASTDMAVTSNREFNAETSVGALWVVVATATDVGSGGNRRTLLSTANETSGVFGLLLDYADGTTVRCFPGGGGNFWNCSAAATWPLNRPVVVAVRVQCTGTPTVDIWLDGVLYPSLGSYTGTFIEAANASANIGAHAGSGSRGWIGTIHFAAGWKDREFSRAEVAKIIANPRNILQPFTRRVWVPSTGSAVPSITAVYADSVTASSVVPRVTLDFA